VAETSSSGPHARSEALERYVRGDLPRAECRELERHLAGCVTCQEALAAAGDARDSTVRWRGHRFTPATATEPTIEPTIDAASARLRGVLRGLGVATDAFGASLLAELLAASEHQRRRLVARDPRFASLPLAERLARSCRAAWLDDPAAAVELARLAVAIASRLDADHYGAAPVADARALAWSQLGSSYRVAAASGGEIAQGAGAEPFERGNIEIDSEIEIEIEDDALYPPARVPASMIGEPAGGADSLAEGWAGEAPLPILPVIPVVPVIPVIPAIPTALAALDAALDAIDDARAAALARGMAFEAALVTLDLAAAHLRRGRADEASAVLAAAPALLAAAGLGEDGAARFRALAGAAAAGALDRPLLENLAAYLSRARNDPAARFGSEG
jgi:hypothetical protein